MECSKETLEDDNEREAEPDKSAMSQIFRLIKSMAGIQSGKRKSKAKKAPKPRRKFGRGPGGERDVDMDAEEESDGDDDEYDDDDDDGAKEELRIVDIRARVLAAGFSEAQLTQTINQVSYLDAFMIPAMPIRISSTKTSVLLPGLRTAPRCGLFLPRCAP